MLHARLMKQRRPFNTTQKPVGSGWNAEIRPFRTTAIIIPTRPPGCVELKPLKLTRENAGLRGRPGTNTHTHTNACNGGHLCTASEHLTRVLLRLPQAIYWLISCSVLLSTHLIPFESWSLLPISVEYLSSKTEAQLYNILISDKIRNAWRELFCWILRYLQEWN